MVLKALKAISAGVKDDGTSAEVSDVCLYCMAVQ